MTTGHASPYRLFGRSDLLMAAFGSLVMAVAGAGMASWFSAGPGGAGYAATYSPSPVASR